MIPIRENLSRGEFIVKENQIDASRLSGYSKTFTVDFFSGDPSCSEDSSDIY
jgi:hypothetical protein